MLKTSRVQLWPIDVNKGHAGGGFLTVSGTSRYDEVRNRGAAMVIVTSGSPISCLFLKMLEDDSITSEDVFFQSEKLEKLGFIPKISGQSRISHMPFHC